MRRLTQEKIAFFREYLINEEKSKATQDKYLRDVRGLAEWLGGRDFDKNDVLRYKAAMLERYAAASVNSVISSLNSLFDCLEWHELKIKTVKLQRRIFADSDRELTKAEYGRLLLEARRRRDDKLSLLMQTICSTGIRVSELRFITVESVKARCADINCKGKRRRVFLPERLCRALTQYVRCRKIKSGSVFVTKNVRPLDRSNIWLAMKKLCAAAGVSDKKVFPHNLRHLFARTYYSLQMDIVRLADILGHSSINTTRIYTMETGEVHREQIQKLGLLRC